MTVPIQTTGTFRSEIHIEKKTSNMAYSGPGGPIGKALLDRQEDLGSIPSVDVSSSS